MTSYDQVLSTWRPSHLWYLGLCDLETALEYAEFDASFGKSSPYPVEVSCT